MKLNGCYDHDGFVCNFNLVKYFVAKGCFIFLHNVGYLTLVHKIVCIKLTNDIV